MFVEVACYQHDRMGMARLIHSLIQVASCNTSRPCSGVRGEMKRHESAIGAMTTVDDEAYGEAEKQYNVRRDTRYP